MQDAVICEPIRTAVGRYGGVFRNVPAGDLAATIVAAVVKRSRIDPELVDDVILGQCYPNGEAPAVGRVAALNAGLPIGVTGYQIDRRCGSGLQAVINAVMQVQSGASEVVIAGGVESMSQAEYYSLSMRWGARGEDVAMIDRLSRGRVAAGGHRFPTPGGMIETAENLRRELGISRQDQDDLALRSHQRAVQARSEGRFDEEVVPVEVPAKGGAISVTMDEHPRSDTNVESLASLKPLMRDQDPDATVTAGNSSGQNDGAAACLVVSQRAANELGLRPLARLKAWAVSGVDPRRMGLGPVPASCLAIERANLQLTDIDLIELNEAFAAQSLACTRTLGLDDESDYVNVNGSGISLGHPVGATGARILATLLHEMARRGAALGLEAMCIGGGQGLAAVFELLD